MSGNSRSKGLLIVAMIANCPAVRKWNEEHGEHRQIRIGQVVLKVTLGRGFSIETTTLGGRNLRNCHPLYTIVTLFGPIQKEYWRGANPTFLKDGTSEFGMGFESRVPTSRWFG